MHFINHQGRLVLTKPLQTHKNYWEELWSKGDLQKYLAAYKNGRLDEYEYVFTRYLPIDEPVLEAGCGRGQLVRALKTRGYQIEGLDYEEKIIRKIQEVDSELNVRVGDIYKIDKPDQYYGGYISLGLFEHDIDGPFMAMREAFRVLKQGGKALISVPYLNKKRQNILGKLPFQSAPDYQKDKMFYQYYFSKNEFSNLLRKTGFKIIDFYPYGVYAGLTRDYRVGRWLHHNGFFSWQLQKRLTRLSRKMSMVGRVRWAHMAMFVCKRA